MPFKAPDELAALFGPNEKGQEHFFGFFTENIGKPNTRRAYYQAACRFSDWCEGRGLVELANVKPMHVAAYIELLGRGRPEGAGLSNHPLSRIWQPSGCYLIASLSGTRTK